MPDIRCLTRAEIPVIEGSIFLRGPTEYVSSSPHLKAETNIASETLFSSYLGFWTMDKVHKPSDSEGLKVSENRVLMRIFGPKRDEVPGA
jgi:hypothetical protein